jgi:hypothetical protein
MKYTEINSTILAVAFSRLNKNKPKNLTLVQKFLALLSQKGYLTYNLSRDRKRNGQ